MFQLSLRTCRHYCRPSRIYTPLQAPHNYLPLPPGSRFTSLLATSAASTLTSSKPLSESSSSSSPGPHPSPKGKGDKTNRISDQEWELRTGQAIFTIQETLPQFFDIGLVVAVDKETGRPAHPSYGDLSHSLNPLQRVQDREYIYSPKVRLSYTPPVHLPSPLPETLQVEGLPLYLASSVFVRTTFNTLYSDIRVNLTKVMVDRPSHTTSSLMRDLPPALSDTKSSSSQSKNRSKSLIVGLEVIGKARVSGADGFWDLLCTYTFCPETGLITSHTVNAIHPIPSQAMYDSLRSNLGRLIGLGPPQPSEPSGGRSVCHFNKKVPPPL